MCYDNYYCNMIDKECILHILSTLSIYPQAPFSLSPSLSSPPLSLGTINFFHLSPLSLWLVRMSINTSTLPYLRYLRYLSQVHVTKKMHHPYKVERSICTYQVGM